MIFFLSVETFRETSLLGRQSLEALTHNFRAVDDVHESGRVDVVKVVFQLDEVGAFQGNVYHVALGAGVKALSEE